MGKLGKTKRYRFIKSFPENLLKNTGIHLDDDGEAYIKSICESTKPHTKIDNKGRNSEYFTFLFLDKLITVVCDANTKYIITAVIETHDRPQFRCR